MEYISVVLVDGQEVSRGIFTEAGDCAGTSVDAQNHVVRTLCALRIPHTVEEDVEVREKFKTLTVRITTEGASA